MDETREVNVGNKVVGLGYCGGECWKPERHIFNSDIWTVILCNDILFIDTTL